MESLPLNHWLKSYPPEIPHTIQIQSSSLVEEFEKSILEFSSKTAFKNYGETLSFKEWAEKSLHFASYLQNDLQLKKGDRIAIQIPNLLQSPIAIMGALKAGLTIVNLNPLYTAREIDAILKDAEVQAILIFSHSACHLEKVSFPLPPIIVTDLEDLFSPFKKVLFYIITRWVKKMVKPFHLPKAETFKSALKKGAGHSFKKVNIQKKDTAFLQYTGGTTGSPKGAVLSHENLLSNVAQSRAWMAPYLKKGGEISITALPLYHIFALTVNFFLLSFYGAESILVTNPRDVKNFVRLLKKEKGWSVFVGVNALFKLLLNTPGFSNLNFSSLQCCIAGGAAVESSVFDQWKKITKTPLVEGYGLTEASPVVSCNLIKQPKKGSCGLPFPSTKVRIVDPHNKEQPPGQIGELQVKGPQVMQGYFKHEKETGNVFDEEGWLKTGDIARIDEEGFIHILDRKKDMILVSGFNVYPSEIEDLLSLHLKIKSSAVIGVPDEKSGEAPKAFIVKKDDSLTKEEVFSYLKENLTAYKRPQSIEFRDELPHSHVGKVLRRSLK